MCWSASAFVDGFVQWEVCGVVEVGAGEHVLGGLRVGLTHDIDMMPELVLERRTPDGEMLRTSPAYHEDLHEGEGPEEVSETAC